MVQGLVVLGVGIGFSPFNLPIAVGVWLSGGVVVLANVWFAWAVRSTTVHGRILVYHMIRFFLYILGVFSVIKFLQQSPLTCAIAMVGAHVMYLLANIVIGSVVNDSMMAQEGSAET